MAETGAKFVTVASKVKFIMHVDRLEEYSVPVMGGGTRIEKRGVKVGDGIEINGPAVPFGKAPSFVVAGGYALTPNVPADFYAEWFKQNRESDLVKNNIVYALERSADVATKAREQKEVVSGLEPLTPDADPRIPKGVKTADRKAA